MATKQNRKPFTKEQQAFILENYKGVSEKKMTLLLKEEFGVICSREKVKNFYKKHDLIPEARSFGSPFSKKEEQFIFQNYKGTSHEQMRDLLREKFGIRHCEASVRKFYQRNGLKSGLHGQFEKGHVPHTKGVPMVRWAKPESIERIRTTQFKKGHVNDNSRPLLPIGTRRKRAEGYVWIKIGQPNTWKEEHRYVWEKAHGPLGRYQKILHIDGDRSNNDLSNLMTVPDNVCAVINHQFGLTRDRELNLVIINLAMLKCKARSRKAKQP